MLYSRRKRLQAMAEAEAAGESFWTLKFDEAVRNKILLALEDAATVNIIECAEAARSLIVRDEGLPYLVSDQYSYATDMELYAQSCSNDEMPTVVEALMVAITSNEFTNFKASTFRTTVQQILREHRISFDLIDNEMIPFSSKEMHTSVVEPVLHLVTPSAEWTHIESSYRAALQEISAGKAADSITDAGTALQQTLELLGCNGNALGPLIKSARKKGLLGSHDSPMLDAIERTMHWVSAERSERGDAHNVTNASIDDAWLMVHVVGAIILRLSRGAR